MERPHARGATFTGAAIEHRARVVENARPRSVARCLTASAALAAFEIRCCGDEPPKRAA
jgi:hypothetical protein